jgi:ADP-ribosyl-[dinitrogen reductase] hydrolase
MSGAWDRDLAIDLDAITRWGAVAVVTLLEQREMMHLRVTRLGVETESRHMTWFHLPIADGSIPDDRFEQEWVRSGEAVRALLRRGASVLIHCRGGLGRAGTIAARLLVELGVPPNQAITAVRKARPDSIETREQENFIRAIHLILEPMPSTSADAIRCRAVGTLVGLAVGDAIGTTLEFKPRDSSPRLTDMVGGGPFRLRAGQWTDDTAMALALADSLAERGRLELADLMSRFVLWWREGRYSCTGGCFDIGITTRAALERFRHNGDPLAGSESPNAAGNGSLMRLSPVAIRYWNDEKSLRGAAQSQSRTTHAAPAAVDACVAMASMLGARPDRHRGRAFVVR